MKKTILLLLATILITSPALAVTGPFGYDLEKDINRNNPKYNNNAANNSQNSSDNSKSETQSGPQYYGDNTEPEWEKSVNFYPNATLSSAVRKYKGGNYSGSLQELMSLAKRDKSNPLVFYYLGMAYAQVGNKDQAVKAYETVMKLNSDKTLTQYANKGRDCLVGGPACSSDNAEATDKELDEFVNSPYGNGFSKEINDEMRQQKLKQIQNTINKKDSLDGVDMDKIRDFDDNKTEAVTEDKIAVTNDDVLQAIETLKKAGVTVSINPYQQPMMQNNEYAQLQALFGNNNNNNNSMMSMLPYLMSQNQNGKNLDPQIFQSMMMNSMIPDFTFNDKKD